MLRPRCRIVALRTDGPRAALSLTAAVVVVTIAALLAAAGAVAQASTRSRPASSAAGSRMSPAQAPSGSRPAARQTFGAEAGTLNGPFQQAKLTASDGAEANDFGGSVAISGSTAVVGASDSQIGAAYVFVRSGGVWRQEAELRPSDGSIGDFFGYSVAISGSTAVVGAFDARAGVGAAYVFVRSGTAWSQQAELSPSDGDSFGFSVAISGSTIVVGASAEHSYAGVAYVFARSGTVWSQQAELTAADGVPGDEFGQSVAISRSTVVVGAAYTNSNAGAAYVFARSGTVWSERAELTPSEPAAGELFGRSVAIAGATAVVGAPYRDSGTGAAYVFVRSGTRWAQQAQLVDAGSARDIYLGHAVAISGDTVVASAPVENQLAGAAYVFTRSGTTWSQLAELTASDGADGDELGYSAAVSGKSAMVGAPSQNDSTGAAYVFAGL